MTTWWICRKLFEEASFNCLRFFVSVLFVSVAFLFLPLYTAQAYTNVYRNIDVNTTWIPQNSPYVLNGNIAVNPGARLTIQPGVVVKTGAYISNDIRYNTGMLLVVQGDLEANGAIFTSAFDDQYGGDTDGDGGLNQPLAGDWGGIEFVPGSTGNVQNSTIQFAGSINSAMNSGVYIEGSSPSFTNTLIRESTRSGVFVASGNPSFVDSKIQENGETGLVSQSALLTTLHGNKFNDNHGAALSIPTVVGADVYDNTYSGNIQNAMFLSRNFPTDAGSLTVLKGSNTPYVLTDLNPSVPVGTEVDIESGAVLKFEAIVNQDGSHGDTARSLTVNGTLNASGAVFTSFFDDSDTESDGTGSTAQRGDWSSVSFASGSSGSLQGCYLLYGGSSSQNNNSALVVNSASPNLISNHVSLSKGRAITVQSGTPAITNSVITSNLGDGLDSAVSLPILQGNQFHDNTGAAVRMPAEIGNGVMNNTYSGNQIDAMVLTGDVGLASEWLGSNSPYVIENTSMHVSGSLSVDQGAVVKFFADLDNGNHINNTRSLSISGSLEASGAVFTSFFDDAYGGDTGHTTGLASPATGDWGDIELGPQSSVSLNSCTFRFGGSTSAGSLAVNGSTGFNAQFTDVTIDHSRSAGLYIEAGNPAISNSYFSNNLGDGLLSDVGLSSLSGNHFISNGGRALSIKAIIGSTGVANNFYQGNNTDAMFLTGSVDQSALWAASNSPYVLGAGMTAVASGAELDIEQGTVVKFNLEGDNTSRFNTGSNLSVYGTLNASGTVFTSLFDDSYGGDTNHDSGQISPWPGDWQSISFLDNSRGSLAGCRLRYGGQMSPELFVSGSSPSISSSFIENSMNQGAYVASGSPSITGTHFSDNGNGGPAGEGLVSESYLAALKDNVFERNHGRAVSLRSTLGTGLVERNTYSDNGYDAMFLVTDNLDADTSLPATNSPYVFDGLELNVPSNVILTLGSGAVLKMEADLSTDSRSNTGRRINVSGNFVAENATITSFADDSAAGDTNNDGGALMPMPGDWSTIQFAPGSSGDLRGCKIMYGGRDAPDGNPEILITGSSPYIARSAITDSLGVGIKITDGNPFIHYNDIIINGFGLENDGDPSLDVSHNWWGSRTGPQPKGRGNGVSGAVYEPWQTVPMTDVGKDYQARGIENACGKYGEPVNTSTGAFVYHHNDIEIPTKGFPLSFERTYNSNDPAEGPLGYGWSFNWQLSVNPLENGDALVLRADGRIDLFTMNPDHTYTAPLGIHDALSLTADGKYRLLTHDQTLYSFDASDRLEAVTSETGQTTSLHYNGNSQLDFVTEPAGRQLAITYYPDGHMREISDPQGNTVSFEYFPDTGDLKQVTDQDGGVTYYSYDGGHHITSIQDPNGNPFVNNIYDASGRVANQKDADGNAIDFTYDPANRRTTMTRRMNPTDPSLDEITVHYYDSELRLVRETDPNNNDALYGYDPAGNRNSVTDRRHVVSLASYDPAGNVIDVYLAYGRPEAEHLHITYNSKNHPLSKTDARGYTTSFAYDPTGTYLEQIDYPAVTGYDN